MILALLLLAPQEGELARLEFFEKKVRPLLVERCYKCHSQAGDSVKGGLLLDSREAILRGGNSGPAVVPGDPEKSPLVRAVRGSDEEIKMPPKARLAATEIADLEAWVRMGAPAPADAAEVRPRIDFDAARRFWSFRPVAHQEPPPVKRAEWPAGAIDRFILAKLEERGFAPAADADPRTLLRRATFDLTGLPPTPEEMESFLSDRSPGAFGREVDRLLASPAYGERWGRHWLDLVRYADSAGDSADYPIPQAHKYRDYVVASFNADRPYDRFVREQVAGDLLGTRDGIVATGFLALARRFGEEPTADHHLTIDDTLDTLGRAVLGLTLGCARCHDHKFDPVTSDDYFAIYGILQSTRYPHSGGDKMKYQKDFVPLVPREEAERVLRPFEEKLAAFDLEAKPLEEEIAARERELAGGKPEARKDERSLQDLRKALGEIRKKREALAKQRPPIDDACAVAEGEPANARIHLKGNPKALGREVPRRFLELLGGQPAGTGSGRRELAEALVSPSNPLTARVMVNRIWQHHFGKGIVRTPSYFGKQGFAPTHPELLDHLAAEFVRSGWSVKAMHRTIMTSRAYRLAPGNGAREDLFGAFARRRLDAEAIRDSILAVSGALDRSAGGPHPFPAAKDWNFSKASPFYAVYPTERRSLYLMQQRLKRHPYLALFDGPDPNASTAERFASTTPLQSLFMLNSPFVHEQAGKFAARVGAVADDRARIDLAHRLALGRPASPEETALGLAFLEKNGWTSYAKVLISSNEFIHVD